MTQEGDQNQESGRKAPKIGIRKKKSLKSQESPGKHFRLGKENGIRNQKGRALLDEVVLA
jgi:hypothetical protein